jgi:hypothetical protein
MNAGAKYTICLLAGVVIEIIGFGLVFAATFTGEHTAPVPVGFGLIFPYAFILSPHGDADGFLGWTLIVVTLLQMPVYGGILAREWVRHGILRALLALGCVHLLAALIGIAMARM